MPRDFDVLIDSFRNEVEDDFVDGLVWVYPAEPRRGDIIQVYGLLQFGRQLGEAQHQLDDARQRDFSEASIWEYLTTHGGNGYTMLRLGPRLEEGESADAVGSMIMHNVLGV